jgi:hypothetical protein
MERRPFTFPIPDDEMVAVGWWFDVLLDGVKIGCGTVERITDEGVKGAIEFYKKAPGKDCELKIGPYRHPEQKKWEDS